MNVDKFCKHDRYLEQLLVLTNAAKAGHTRIGRAVQVTDILRHKHQVADLILSIGSTLNNYSKWASGFNLVTRLIELRIKLECYNDRVLTRVRLQPVQTVESFNGEIRIFQDLVNELLDLFEN